jgi:hypothetical protein
MPYIHEGDDLYLNADKSKIVPENSPEAAYLLVSRGGTLSDEDAERYGLFLTPRDLAPGEMLEAGQLPDDSAATETGEPVVEFTPAPAFEEQVSAGAEGDDDQGEKAKEAKPNKAKGPPANKAR